MENYLLYFLKLNLYFIVLILTYKVLFRKYTNFNFSRPYLLFGILVAFLLPLLTFTTLNQYGEKIAINHLLQEVEIVKGAFHSTTLFNWSTILSYFYLIGSAFYFIRFILKMKRLFLLKAQTTELETHFVIPNSSSAFSFMNWIFIGDQLSKEDLEIVLAHEEVHVAKKHSVDLIICHLLEVFLWINPFVFQLKNLFDEVHEYEADELSCQEEEDYLHLLLKQSFNHFSYIPIHQFNSTHLKKRIMRIKTQSSRKITPKAIVLSTLAFVTLFFINQNLNSNELPHYESNAITLLSSKLGEVDKVAQFPGGKKALFNYIIENTKYPKHLLDKDIQGKVLVEFKVGADGKISNVKLKNKSHAELEKMALATVKKMPNWIPAEKDGKKVASKLTIPIKFLAPPPPPPAPKVPTPPAPPKG